ncbi:helix-turn-helix domain-containing protein [Actinopolyspora mortivallis]|uniref:helix-turn-helix domain-containing protein n=1 Tax=Actinopolyspora mortivallis TaxID=33906 RepID=UPI000379B0B4|nr:helix-turn-helix transcriptional regulator [Actinopolyspora mortivallis]
MDDEENAEGFPLGERISFLRRTLPKPGGGRYTWDEVVTGTGVGRSYLYELRAGNKTDPSMRIVKALAEFFSVPVDFLVAEDERALRYARQMDTAIRLGEADVVHIAARSGELSPHNRRLVCELVERLAALENEANSGEG